MKMMWSHLPFLTSLLLAPLHAAENSSAAAATASQADLTKYGETLVYTVDQAASDKPHSWTHRVVEAGDYQIGMAWVEVSIKAGGKMVRSVKARPGLAPQRLDARIEKLAAGDEITVIATPKSATYRLGYQIAFGTPTFPGARIFHVKGFGAVGDGVTDDFAAIQRAVAAAREAGCAILQFDGAKSYRAIGLSDFTEEALFDLNGAKYLKIEGGRATVLLPPPDSFARVSDAENIQMSHQCRRNRAAVGEFHVTGRRKALLLPDQRLPDLIDYSEWLRWSTRVAHGVVAVFLGGEVVG